MLGYCAEIAEKKSLTARLYQDIDENDKNWLIQCQLLNIRKNWKKSKYRVTTTSRSWSQKPSGASEGGKRIWVDSKADTDKKSLRCHKNVEWTLWLINRTRQASHLTYLNGYSMHQLNTVPWSTKRTIIRNMEKPGGLNEPHLVSTFEMDFTSFANPNQRRNIRILFW